MKEPSFNIRSVSNTFIAKALNKEFGLCADIFVNEIESAQSHLASLKDKSDEKKELTSDIAFHTKALINAAITQPQSEVIYNEKYVYLADHLRLRESHIKLLLNFHSINSSLLEALLKQDCIKCSVSLFLKIINNPQCDDAVITNFLESNKFSPRYSMKILEHPKFKDNSVIIHQITKVCTITEHMYDFLKKSPVFDRNCIRNIIENTLTEKNVLLAMCKDPNLDSRSQDYAYSRLKRKQ